MKRTFISIMLIVAASLSFAVKGEISEIDTLYKLSSAKEIIVYKNSEGITVNTEKENGEYQIVSLKDYINYNLGDYALKHKENETIRRLLRHDLYIFPSFRNNSYFSIGIDGIGVGLTSANGQPFPALFQWTKSFEITWLNICNIKYNYKASFFSFGIGLNWRNFRCTTSDFYLTSAGKNLHWECYPFDCHGESSQLKIFSVQFPLLYSIQIPTSALFLRIGPIMNINLYSSIKSEMSAFDGNTINLFSKESLQKTFTFDTFCSISYRGLLGIYFRYSPIKILKGSVYNFHPLSIGITIGI